MQQKSPEISDSLKDWLNEVKEKYGYQSSYLSTSDSINQLSDAQTNDLLEAYLMVIIRPVKPLSRRKFRVNGFLKIGESFEQWIYPNYKPEELTLWLFSPERSLL